MRVVSFYVLIDFLRSFSKNFEFALFLLFQSPFNFTCFIAFFKSVFCFFFHFITVIIFQNLLIYFPGRFASSFALLFFVIFFPFLKYFDLF